MPYEIRPYDGARVGATRWLRRETKRENRRFEDARKKAVWTNEKRFFYQMMTAELRRHRMGSLWVAQVVYR
ncbi:MAG: hypothetical protein NW202_13360 [Nitrospira sp.]|nr:hypothetical protein [Nitrospira sp.]